MKNIIQVVCAVIFNPEGKVLLCRRAQGKAHAGLWEFPGGKVELGEFPQSALKREIREELGREVVIEGSMPEVETSEIILQPWRAYFPEVSDFELTAHSAVEWVPSKEILQREMPPGDQEIAKQLQKEE